MMKKKLLISVIFFSYFTLSPLSGMSKEFSLQEFLKRVGEDSLQLQSLQEKQKGLEFTLSQAHLIYSPYVFGSFGYSNDQRQKLNTQFTGIQTIGKLYEFGIGKRFTFGADLKLGHTNQFADVRGTSLQNVTAYEPALKLTLALPLWRNRGGVEWESQSLAQENNWRAQIYQTAQQEKNLIAFSQNLYWKYATLLAIKELQIQGLKRSHEIETWANSRVQNSLGDKSDLFQAQAVVVGKELNLNETEEEIQKTKIDFESLLNRDEQKLGASEIDQWELPKEIPLPAWPHGDATDSAPMMTAEVQSIFHRSESEQNSYKEVKEKNRFKLDLVADYAWTARERDFNDSWNELKTGDYPWWTFAIKYEQSLDFDSVGKVEAGQYQLINAAKKDYQNSLQKVQKDWRDLVIRWKLFDQKQILAKKLEDIQKRKLDFERNRLKTGRTTTFQVLQFEFDYLQSQLQHLQAKLELWNLKSQAETFFPIKS